jgi:hypothetical protein
MTPVSNLYFRFSFSRIQKSGGAGRIRTADKQFRKLLLYPSELQPRASILILLYCNTSRPFPFRPCFFKAMAELYAVIPRFVHGMGAICVMRRLREIAGQYSRNALAAVFSPMRIP